MDAAEAPSAYVDGFTVPVAGIAALEVAFVGHRYVEVGAGTLVLPLDCHSDCGLPLVADLHAHVGWSWAFHAGTAAGDAAGGHERWAGRFAVVAGPRVWMTGLDGWWPWPVAGLDVAALTHLTVVPQATHTGFDVSLGLGAGAGWSVQGPLAWPLIRVAIGFGRYTS